jgi:NAD(P)-dependent dehydrogenase (short-subunit alcohol dehydrogenase family)
MKKLVVFGGNGGLGTKLAPLLREKYEVLSPGSKDVDITNLKEVTDYFQANDIDIVINMAGKKYDTFLSKIDSDNYEEISSMLDINVKGNINILAACLPPMIQKRWGRIISISSVFAELNVPKNSVYCASKAFVDRLTSVANKENIKYGITCNTIQLGYWDGGMCYRVEQEYQDKAKQKIGLKRWGTAEELNSTINYIIETEYLCGTNLRIDGGL